MLFEPAERPSSPVAANMSIPMSPYGGGHYTPVPMAIPPRGGHDHKRVGYGWIRKSAMDADEFNIIT